MNGFQSGHEAENSPAIPAVMFGVVHVQLVAVGTFIALHVAEVCRHEVDAFFLSAKAFTPVGPAEHVVVTCLLAAAAFSNTNRWEKTPIQFMDVGGL